MRHAGAILVWTAFLGLLAGVPRAALGSVFDSSEPSHELARAGLEAMFAGEQARADSLLEAAAARTPDDPLVSVQRLKVSWWRILQGRVGELDLDGEFERNYAAVRQLCEARLDRDADDLVALYALGEAHCTAGRLHGIHGSAWSTLREHQRGVPYLERVVELDPSAVEPLASLGVFHYYAARAPGFLRFLARFFSVQGDRKRGLDELRRAASTPNVQSTEAAFFLLEVLTNVEDELLEALPLALQFHARYPRNVGFRIALATVQIGLQAPASGIRVLEDAIHDSDPNAATTARFFLARALGMAGRPSESAALLESFTPRDFGTVAWLSAWHPYYLGVAYEQLGRADEARASYRLVEAVDGVADSHGFAQRALDRRPGTLLSRVQRVETAFAWGEDVREPAAALRQAIASKHGADAETRRRAGLALAVVELQRGNPSAARAAITPVVRDAAVDEAWLMVRPRIRLLQALLWAGDFEAARSAALVYQNEAGKWGSNRQLELLIDSCLRPDGNPALFETRLEPHPGECLQSFHLPDAGFTAVRIERRLGRMPHVQAMRWNHGTWEIELPLPPGRHEYRFRVEADHPLVDPGNHAVIELNGELWSQLWVEPPSGS